MKKIIVSWNTAFPTVLHAYRIFAKKLYFTFAQEVGDFLRKLRFSQPNGHSVEIASCQSRYNAMLYKRHVSDGYIALSCIENFSLPKISFVLNNQSEKPEQSV